ncbi:MAG: sodium/proline symporter [Gammaproteobacteria bacterium]|jgi:sodium/proline symporter
MTSSATIIGVLVVYLLILLIIGYWGGKESKDVKGYYVAGKKLPAWVIAFSTNTTGESAWLILGLTGMGYLIGVHAFWVILGEVMGVTLAWVLVARPFKEYTDRYDAITVPDYLASRFRDNTHTLRILSAVIIFSMAAFYIAAQITASGKAFESFVGTSYEMGAIIGAVIILYYTTVGGFKAVAYSDLLQGVLMVACLLILPIVGISAAGGWTEMITSLGSIDSNLLKPMGEHGISGLGIASALGFVAIGFAFLGSPQLLIRFISAKNTDTITNASMISVFCAIIFDIGAIFSGMAGRVLFPLLEDPETIYPLMGTELFPAAFTGIFLVVVLAAIMSTADSLLILASSAVVRDVIQKVFQPGWSDKTFSRWGKGVTVVLGVIALALALPEVRVIFWFVLFAWSGLACFTPVILCSLFWKGTTLAGAIAGLVAGFGTTVLWVLVLKEHFYDLYEMIPGFAMGFLATIIVSLFTKKPEGAIEEFYAVHKSVGSPFKKPIND